MGGGKCHIDEQRQGNRYRYDLNMGLLSTYFLDKEKTNIHNPHKTLIRAAGT